MDSIIALINKRQPFSGQQPSALGRYTARPATPPHRCGKSSLLTTAGGERAESSQSAQEKTLHPGTSRAPPKTANFVVTRNRIGAIIGLIFVWPIFGLGSSEPHRAERKKLIERGANCDGAFYSRAANYTLKSGETGMLGKLSARNQW